MMTSTAGRVTSRWYATRRRRSFHYSTGALPTHRLSFPFLRHRLLLFLLLYPFADSCHLSGGQFPDAIWRKRGPPPPPRCARIRRLFYGAAERRPRSVRWQHQPVVQQCVPPPLDICVRLLLLYWDFFSSILRSIKWEGHQPWNKERRHGSSILLAPFDLDRTCRPPTAPSRYIFSLCCPTQLIPLERERENSF